LRYFDASALAKRYVLEPESASVRRLLASETPATSRLSEVEIASALARRCRDGSVSVDERDQALAQLRDDIGSMNVVELSPDIAALAASLLLRHPLRASDAIQLASCLHVARQLETVPEFVVDDAGLGAAARNEGVRVVGAR
jgi:predicted nucleic acid-binding protein